MKFFKKNISFDSLLGTCSFCFDKKKKILIHGVSAGEVKSSLFLIELFYKDYEIILSSSTHSGQMIIRKIKKSFTISSCFFPFDFFLSSYFFLKRLKPDLIILIEAELWPNFIRLSKFFDIPLIVINGFISQKAFKRYRYAYPFVSSFLKKVTFFFVQSEKIKNDLLEFKVDPLKIDIHYSLKFYNINFSKRKSKIINHQINAFIKKTKKLIIAASFHRKETISLIKCFKDILKFEKRTLLILVPRHPEKDSIYFLKEAQNENIKVLLWSEKSRLSVEKKEKINLLIINKIGILEDLYPYADSAIIGGSFQKDIGSHNLLEALDLEKDIILGPYQEPVEPLLEKIPSDFYKLLKKDLSSKEGQKAFINLMNNKPLRILKKQSFEKWQKNLSKKLFDERVKIEKKIKKLIQKNYS